MINILAEGGAERLHRERLLNLCRETSGVIRIASAYVTDRRLLIHDDVKRRDVRLLTSLVPMDLASGATSLESLGALLGSGVSCRFVSDRPRLHAKVYLFGSELAIVTSANLTENALGSNIEVGIEIQGARVGELIQWYDNLWSSAKQLRLKHLSELQQRIAPLRRDFVRLKEKARERLQEVSKSSGKGKKDSVRDDLAELFQSAAQFFVCNTDRRQGERTQTGGYTLEQEMYNRGIAAAWETFRYPPHMRQVSPGDAILMFAKSVGIIAIGRATGNCAILQPGDPDRIRDFTDEENTPEWRVPVTWLNWRDEQDAFRWNSPNFTFFNVSDERYSDFRLAVKDHFAAD